jgi:hypothetical protein
VGEVTRTDSSTSAVAEVIAAKDVRGSGVLGCAEVESQHSFWFELPCYFVSFVGWILFLVRGSILGRNGEPTN